MPTGSLEGEGKALWERIYDKALKGSCKGDKECAARTAWAAIKNAGWSKGEDGKWHKKAVLSEFSLYISRASFDKATQHMNWFAVASDTGDDSFQDNMTESLFDDFVNRIKTEELPPEKYRSSFWSGGMPYMSLSHYPDLEGKAVPGKPERVYRDGNRLKADGYFLDTPLGRACFRSICNDLYNQEKSKVDEPVRISIAFLDYSHRHKSSGYVFERSEDEPVCMECVKEHFDKTGEGLEFLKGHLIHLALTRVPANVRTLIEPMEVDKMAINTRKEDALAIVGEDEEVQNLVEEIAEEASMVGKSELVIKSEDEIEPMLVEEAKYPDSDFLVVEADGKQHLQVKRNGKPDHNLMAAARAALTSNFRGHAYGGPNKAGALKKLKSLYKSEGMDWEKKSMADEVETQAEEEAVVETVNEEVVVEDKTDKILDAISEMKSLFTKPEPVAHPLDAMIEALKSAYDEVIKIEGSADEKLTSLQEPFNAFSQAIIEQVRSTVPVEHVVEAKSEVSEEAVINAVMQKLEPKFEEMKSLLMRGVPAQEKQEQPNGLSVGELVHRRSFMPKNNVTQETLQKSKNGLYSIRDVVEKTT